MQQNGIYSMFCISWYSAVSSVFIIAAKRTAFGTFGGKLKNVSSTQLGVVASKAAIEAGNLKPEDINSVIFGNVITVC